MHPVVTKDYPENQVDGILICGINFGQSKADKRREKAGIAPPVEPASFFSDNAVNSTGFRNKIVKWFAIWGLDLAQTAGQEGPFERSIVQTNWLDTQSGDASTITHSELVQAAGGFLQLVADRKPAVIMLFGYALMDALNDVLVRGRMIEILGACSGDPVPRGGPQLALYAQRYGDTQVIFMPHPRAAVSDEHIASLKPPIHIVRRILEKRPKATR